MAADFGFVIAVLLWFCIGVCGAAACRVTGHPTKFGWCAGLLLGLVVAVASLGVFQRDRKEAEREKRKRATV